MKTESLTISLRLSAKRDGKVKAFVDVTIPLGDDGTVTVLGFSVLDGDGRPARVMAPARKGQKAWFEFGGKEQQQTVKVIKPTVEICATTSLGK